MGKTVTTYLIDGDPKGTQYVFISNKICQMYVIPRSNLSILNERQELQTPAFYILLGEDEATKPKAYIGETENFRERVKDHDSKKAFWQKALLFISKDAAMTNAIYYILPRRYYELAGDMAAYSLATDWDINQVWAVILPFLQKYGKAKRADLAKIVGGHLSEKQLRRFLDIFKSNDFLRTEGQNRNTVYLGIVANI